MTFNKHVWSQEKKHCQVRATEQDKKIKELQNKLAITCFVIDKYVSKKDNRITNKD